MSDLNQVQLIGRLGADPDVKYSASGAAIANLSLATGEVWKDKQTGEKKERTEWHRITFFGRQGEVCGEYLKKGSQVYVSGKLQTRKWQDKDGNDRYTTEVIGNNMIMLGGRGDAAPAQGGFRDKPKPEGESNATEEDIPF